MNNLMSMFSSLFNEKEYLTLIVFVFLTAVLNHKKLFESYDFFRKRKLEQLKAALDNNYVTGLTRERLSEDIENESYRLATGIFIEKELRETIICAHKKTKGRVGFYHFLRAKSFMVTGHENPQINIQLIDKISYYYNLSISFIMLLFGIVFFITPTYTKQKSIEIITASFIIGFFFLGLFLLFVIQTRPYHSANLIKKHLDMEGRRYD